MYICTYIVHCILYCHFMYYVCLPENNYLKSFSLRASKRINFGQKYRVDRDPKYVS